MEESSRCRGAKIPKKKERKFKRNEVGTHKKDAHHIEPYHHKISHGGIHYSQDIVASQEDLCILGLEFLLCILFALL